MAKYIRTEEGYKTVENMGFATVDVANVKMDATNPVGTGSFSMNRKAGTIVGANSVALGDETMAIGQSSHAEGNGTTASGACSHAEGKNTTTSGMYSHAEGNSTVASNDCSHAEGNGTTASGDCSHAEGYKTTASGAQSHAEGGFTTASGSRQHVQGKFNIVDSTYAHIVGNGTSDTDRSNAHTLDWNGVGWFQGGLQIGGNAQDHGAKNVLLEGDAIPVPTTATVGQLLCVKAVDENGKPIEWETVDAPSGEGSGNSVELDTTLTEEGKAADAKAVGDALANLDGYATKKYVDNAIENLEIPEGGTVTDEQIASAVEDYMVEHPIEGGSASVVAAVETFKTQPIGQLFEQPVNYAFWSPQSLRWDKNLEKYVDVIYGTTDHMAGASAHSLWVSYIDPDTLMAEAPVQCRYVDADGNDVTLDDAGTGAWMILDDGKYLLFNFISGKMYRFISSDYGKTWVQEQECSGYSSTQELYFLVKLSNGRLLANSCEMQAIARSDDMGVTWQTTTPTNSIGGNLMAEINFFEVNPGVVIAIGRYSMSGMGVNESGDCQHAIISYSEDYGATWTPWKLSDTIDNMNASCCTGYVHDGILELFTGSRWYHRGTNATTDYTNTGKSGAITHYTATIENALVDKFTNMGVVVYSKAQGDLSSQDFHTPCVAVNGKDMLMVYCDRVYPYTEEKTNHYFVRGYMGGSMDYSPKDDIVSAVFPYSSEKIMHLLAKQKSELIVLMNEAILSNKPVVPDGGGDGGAYAYILDGIVANFNMLDASKYDTENLTITDSVHGLTAQLYGCEFSTTPLTEMPTIRDNSTTAAAIYFSDNPLGDYISADEVELTLEWSSYKYDDDESISTSGYIFQQTGFRIAAYGAQLGRYLQTDGTTFANCGNVLKDAGYGGVGGYVVDNLLYNRSHNGHQHSVVTLSKDGTLRTYKNGEKTVEYVMPDFLKWDTKLVVDAFRMGAHCRSMRIYSRPLTDAEVLNNYEYEKQFIV